MTRRVLQHYADEFAAARDLGADAAEILFDTLISETDEESIERLLRAWDEKGFTADEIFYLATIMRGRMKRVDPRGVPAIDIVGTGGSKAKTFNVSTAAAFVVAGAGIAVAKHGNRAATSNSGSADVLSLLGVKAELSPEVTQRCLDETGICFMYAPHFHSLSPTLAVVRRKLGFPTVFNCLGPLCNPACVPFQVIGVWKRELVDLVAEVVLRLGTQTTWVVHGEEGLDEITIRGRTIVASVEGNEIHHFELSPADFGIPELRNDLSTPADAAESAALIREILGHERVGSAEEALVLMNAAAAIFVARGAESLPKAFLMAADSIATVNAGVVLAHLAAESHR